MSKKKNATQVEGHVFLRTPHSNHKIPLLAEVEDVPPLVCDRPVLNFSCCAPGEERTDSVLVCNNSSQRTTGFKARVVDPDSEQQSWTQRCPVFLRLYPIATLP